MASKADRAAAYAERSADYDRIIKGRQKQSGVAKNIAAKGDKVRSKGRTDVTTGSIGTALGLATAAIGAPIIGAVSTTLGVAQVVNGNKQINEGRSIRSRAQAIDNLVNRSKTGNTVGVRGAKAANATNSGDTFERKYTTGPKAGTTETVKKPRRD